MATLTTTLPPVRSKSARPLTPRESEALFYRWQKLHDRTARDELVQRFLPLARKLARRYNVGHEPFDDLLQVASLGLVKAVDRFDCSRGNAFSSFAVPTILGELKRYFRDHGWAVHVPRGAQERAVKVEDAQQQLSVRSGRAPTVPELAEYLELSIEEVLESLETARAHHATSLDAPHDDGEGFFARVAAWVLDAPHPCALRAAREGRDGLQQLAEQRKKEIAKFDKDLETLQTELENLEPCTEKHDN